MSIEHREPQPTREPIVEEIDFTNQTWDKESQRDLIIERLKALGIYQENLLFRACDGDKLEIIKRHGAYPLDQEAIWCSTEGELVDDYALEDSSLDYFRNYRTPALAIYDGNQMKESDDEAAATNSGYLPLTNCKDALLAIFLIR